MKKTILVILCFALSLCGKSGDGDAAKAAPVAPTIKSTSPKDGALGFQLNTAIAVNFSVAMDTSTLTTSTTTTCAGTIQVSLNNFTSCIAMTSATPAFSNGNATATITPTANLTAATNYKLRVTTAVSSAENLSLAAVYTSATGFSSNTYTLNVNRTGMGTGTVASDPTGVNCGGDCSEVYMGDSVLTLTATPAINSLLTAWSGGCSGNDICTITMTANTSVSANFDIKTYNVVVNKTGTGTGTVTGTGINCGTDCSEIYNHGTSVTLTATPGSLMNFTGWTGAGCSGTGTCFFTADGAKTIEAQFTAQLFNLTVTKSGAGAGTVNSNPAGIDCGSDCVESYSANTVVILSATPTAGTFGGWSGSGCAGTGTCTVTMNAARSVTANFIP